VPLRTLLLALAAVLAACGTSPGAASVAPFADADEIEIVATEFAFEPVVIRTSPGEEVNIRLTNEGRMQHDVYSREIGLFAHAAPRQSVVIGFVTPEPGLYELICSIPGHVREGMVMELVVEE
jgi:plastocyanin